MGPQQVLRAATSCAVAAALAGSADAAPRHRETSGAHERVAIIDLGPPDGGAARRTLGTAVVAAGMDPLLGDGLDDALAGVDRAGDDALLAVAISAAKEAFGELDCAKATQAAREAIGLGAARQAAGIAVPELPRALAYVLTCADRNSDTGVALVAASRLRVLGGSPEVPPALMTKYPDIDAVSDRDTIEVDVNAEVPGAELWVDLQPVGKAPMHMALPAGEHVIAAASGTRRGFVAGTAVRKQKVIDIAMPDRAGKYSRLAARVAGWHGALPAVPELASVLGEVHARVALVRHGDVIEVWGRAGLAEPLRRLGGDQDGVRKLAEADRAVALALDRVQTWDDRAPDPDQPLLVESGEERKDRRVGATNEAPTKWWVYATIAGAVVGAAVVIYAKNNADDVQRVQVKYP